LGPTSFELEPPAFGYPHFHTGVDLAAPLGTPVVAVSSGLVEFAGTQVDSFGSAVGYGNFVKIAADTHEEVYAHLLVVAVTTNETVSTGRLIGSLGSTGSSTGPHLHFEIRVNSVAIDPSAMLSC
jgi:murein DD-endopeptidase MepM/ murein hydrolase activator NlpD